MTIFRNKTYWASVIIAISLMTTSVPTAQAAQPCQEESDAYNAAQATLAGAQAALVAAKAAVGMAQSKASSAMLPAQRVSAQVALMREKKNLTKVSSALKSIKVALTGARTTLAECKKK
jgi:hypothetical protein